MQTDKVTVPPLPKHLSASLFPRDQSLTLLTALRGAGKTTFCTEFVVQVQEKGLSIGGIICPAVFADGKKIGIDLLNIATGERQRLGKLSQSRSESTVGCWQLDENVIAWGNQILAKLDVENFIIIDELGPLELEEGYGFQEALRLLDEGRYRAALVVVRPALVPLARLRWPRSRVLELERGGA